MTNALFTCTACNDIFRSRSDLNNHVRRDHQSSVTVKYQNGSVKEVKRAADNTFKCKCEKSFKLPDSLRRHVKGCNDESGELEEDEDEIVLMDADDSDASELMDVEDMAVPIDCVGTRVSHEKADCR
jgi:uncharacterized C2H2 Zn-finger protein